MGNHILRTAAAVRLDSFTGVWTNGEDHPMNTMRTMFGAGPSRHRVHKQWGVGLYAAPPLYLLVMDAQVIRQNGGLPIADFFIWNDDFEFSTVLRITEMPLLYPLRWLVITRKLLGRRIRSRAHDFITMFAINCGFSREPVP